MSKQPIEDRPYLTVIEAAALARVHPNTIKRWCYASADKAKAGLPPDFIASKPGGKENSPWRINAESFRAHLERIPGLAAHVPFQDYPRPDTPLCVGDVRLLSLSGGGHRRAFRTHVQRGSYQPVN